jgi:hypothetical protein
VTKFNKTVLLPISVPNSNHCWDGMIVCEHFSNEGGHGTCDLNIDVLKRDKTGYYPKPKRCLDLKEK